MFMAALFIMAKIWKQPKCLSVDDWIEKLWYIYTMEYYTAVKKKKLTVCNTKDGPREYYAKLNKLVRERQIPYDLTHM